MKSKHFWMPIMAILATACGHHKMMTTLESSTVNPDLIGTWKTPCMAGPSTGDSNYALFQLNEDGSFSTTNFNFKNTSSCNENLAYSKSHSFGNLKLTDTVVTAMNTTGSQMSPLSDDAVSDFQTQAQCGHSSWTIDTAQDCQSVQLLSSVPQGAMLSYQVNGINLTLMLCPVSGNQSCYTLYQYTRVIE